MIIPFSISLLALSVSAVHIKRDGGLLATLPINKILPVALTNEVYTALGAIGETVPLPVAVVQSTLFGSNVTTGTILVTLKGDNTSRYLEFAEYNLITDRHLAENFTIPAYTCGNVTRFGIATASDKNASPYMAPAQYEYDFDYYGSNYRSHPDFSYGYSTRCFKTAAGATSVQSNSGNTGLWCQSDVWRMDCKTKVLTAAWTNLSDNSSVPLTLSVGAGSFQYEVNTMSAASFAQYGANEVKEATYTFVAN